MICCNKCFEDPEIQASIISLGHKGNCPSCKSDDVYLYDFENNSNSIGLEEHLNSILEIYCPNTLLPDNYPENEKKAIEDRVLHDWNIFKNDIKIVKKIIKIITLLLVIAGSLIFATTSPIFNVKYIEVTNNNQIDTNTIISISGLNIDQNIFKFFKKNIQNNIKSNAYIEDVNIKRVLPNKIQIFVKEREKKFSLEFLNGYAYINTQGYILEISQDKLDLPVIQGATTAEEEIVAGNRLNQEDLKRLESVIRIIDSAKENGLDTNITSIDISNKSEYNLYLESDKKTIHLGDATNLTNKMLRVQAIIEAEKGIEGDIFVNGDFNNKFKAYFREKV